MINFFYETEFQLKVESDYSDWINRIFKTYEKTLGEVNYIFGSDDYVLDINKQYLDHDYYTDIITFDNSEGAAISSDIFISVDRVEDNAKELGEDPGKELLRVMSHGLLHLFGYGDKTEEESAAMRKNEEECIKLFHVEHS